MGVCAAGKTTLINELQQQGFHCRHIAQEHSYVPDMWQRLTKPDLLLYLTVSYEKTLERRNLNWTFEEYQVQLDRLKHARTHADIIIDTETLGIDEVVSFAVKKINHFLSSGMESR